MRVILLGPVGVGKGTQGIRLAASRGMPHVAAGDLLRAAAREGTAAGLAAQQYMNRGELVPDEVVVDILRERLSAPDAQEGFVLDGFPRTTGQAVALREMLVCIDHTIDAVISLEAPDEEVVARLASRVSCTVCGEPYSRPIDAAPGTCDRDGTPLVRREDDEPAAIRRRLTIFHEETKPVLEHYEREGLLLHVDGLGTVDEVTERIQKALA